MEEQKEFQIYEEIIKIILKRRKIIILIVVCTTLSAGVVSFLLTPIYRSEASVIPVASGKTVPSIAELVGSISGISLTAQDPSTKIMAVLESRTIKERVIKKLNLVDELLEEIPEDIDPVYVAAGVLKDMVSISQKKKTGVITIGVEYKDPIIAQKIANAYIEELQEILNEKSFTLAKANRVFLEQQLKDTEEELKRTLAKLTEFQRQEKVIIPEEQVKGSFKLYSELMSQKIALQIELRRLRSVLSEENPQIKYIKEQIRAIDKQLSSIERKGEGMSALPGLEQAPEKMAEFQKVFVKVKNLQTKYESLLKLYEQAKIEEQRDNIFVEVIDPPYLPNKPVKPKKKQNIAIAFVLSLFMGISIAFAMEKLPDLKTKYNELKNGENREN